MSAGRPRAALTLLALWALAATLAPVSTTFAQGALPTEVRIGVVLPDEAPGDDLASTLREAVALDASHGAEFAQEELGRNAELLGVTLEVLQARAANEAGARAEALRLLEQEHVTALVGGFGEGRAGTLAALAADHDVPFLNVGSSADALRNEACDAHAFHVVPSAAMYLDALAGWYVRSGFRRWMLVQSDDAAGDARAERLRAALRTRHFGARVVGRSRVDPAAGFDEALAAIRRANPDVVVLLLGAPEQVAFLRAFDATDLQVQVTGFPDAEAQTRAFYAAVRGAAPRSGAGYRASAWEATLDAYGARELNARFRTRWGAPMDAPAWAVLQAVKVVLESALAAGTADGDTLIARLTAPDAVFDVWKGIGVTFRPWDHQLRQSLYLVKLADASSDTPVLLVGELPALYLPRTDPVERLDQLGDLASSSRCRL